MKQQKMLQKKRSFPLMRSVKNRIVAALISAVVFFPIVASAQSVMDSQTRREMALPVPTDPSQIMAMPAKRLFGRQKDAADLKARAIGTYAKGCLAGAKAISTTGEAWQVMRLSRNRMWGHPDLINLVEDLGVKAKAAGEWNGLLVGDISQPRGGPMLTGHASHQIGLDADIWLSPMPDKILSQNERENISAVLMTKNRSEINPKVWTENQAKLIQRAAKYDKVGRIFVHPPIKAELCRWARGDRTWLAKVRPMFGHNYHFHIRMKCPAGVQGCKDQWTPKPKDGTGCGEELAYWMSDIPWKPRKPDPTQPKIKPKPVPPLTLAGLPAECRAVIAAP
jgi:penicillin-insensitive murein DD-endopeptidase